MARKAVAARMGGRALLSMVAMEVDGLRERMLDDEAARVSPALDAAWMLLNRLAAGESLDKALDTAADLFERSARTWEANGGTHGFPVEVAALAVVSGPFEVRLGSALGITAGSLAEAAGWWCGYRDKRGLASSESPAVTVLDLGGRKVYRVSYNGRVWAADGSEVVL